MTTTAMKDLAGVDSGGSFIGAALAFRGLCDWLSRLSPFPYRSERAKHHGFRQTVSRSALALIGPVYADQSIRKARQRCDALMDPKRLPFKVRVESAENNSSVAFRSSLMEFEKMSAIMR